MAWRSQGSRKTPWMRWIERRSGWQNRLNQSKQYRTQRQARADLAEVSQQSQQLYTLSVQSYLSLSNHRPVSKEPSAMVAESPWASETSQRLDPAVAPGTSPSALPRTFALGRVGRLTRFVSAACPAVVLRQGSRCWAARFVGPGDPKLLTWVLSWACSPTQNT